MRLLILLMALLRGVSLARTTSCKADAMIYDSRPLSTKATNNIPPLTSSLNVLDQPLEYFGGTPIRSGFFRDGFCRTSAQDHGSHSVAGIVSSQFLEFSASRGNDLRTIGLEDGCRWCLCAGRWMEAYQTHAAGLIPKEAVPRVDLRATENSALRQIDLSILKQFSISVDTEVGAAVGSSEL